MPRRYVSLDELTTVNPQLVDVFRNANFTEPREPIPAYNEGMPGTTTQTVVPDCTCPACEDIRGTAAETPNPTVGAIGDDLPEAYAPARGHQLRNVSNGEYTFETGERDENDQTELRLVQVWTVSNGNLAGQRIIRRQVNGRYEGFATLQEDGTVWIWRSASELRGSRMHRVMNTQFRTMHHQGTRLLRGVPITLNELSVRIISQRCNLCNTPMTTRAAYCTGCMSRQDASIQMDEAQFGAVIRQAPRTTTRTRSDIFAAQSRPAARQVRAPLMSEIDPTRIR
jgi:hypothetical protein